MKRLATLLLLCLCAGACTNLAPDSPKVTPDSQIHAYVEELVRLNEVPGLAFAVVQNGKVTHENYYGVSDTETQAPVDHETVFRIYSLSKLMTVVAIFEQIEQGRLDLGTPLSQFFNDTPNDWNDVTIGHLLAHASGLPDIRTLTKELADESLFEDDFFKLIYRQNRQYQTGDDWSYTQTNYLLLKRVLEELTNEKFEDHIRTQQFSFVDLGRVIYSSNDFDDIAQRSTAYKYRVGQNNYEQKLENYGPRNNVLAGLNLTLKELMRWSEDFDQGRFLDENTRDVMWAPFAFNESDEQFSYGWGIYPVADQISYGFTGGGVSGLRKFPNHDLTIIVLSNGFKYYSVHNTLINHVAGMLDADLENKPVALARMYQHEYLKTKRLDSESLYDRTVRARPELDPEEVMTSFGYKMLDIREPVHATKVFLEISRRNPDSIRALENLGHAYVSQDQQRLALEAFERMLVLDPGNAAAKKMSQGLRQKL